MAWTVSPRLHRPAFSGTLFMAAKPSHSAYRICTVRPLRSAIRRLPRRVVLVVAALVAALGTVAYTQVAAPGPPTFSNITDTSVIVTTPADPDCFYTGERPYNLLNLQRKLTSQADTAYTNIAIGLYSSTATSVAGLSPGIGYTFRCIKTGHYVTTTPPGTPASMTTLPSSPNAPTITNVTQTSLTSTAPALPAGATSLTLQKKLGSEADSAYASVATGLAGGAVTNVTGLSAATVYRLRYLAVGAGGSMPGTSVGVTTTPPPPAAPTNLTATAGNTQISLAWTGSSGATSYNLKRSATSGGPYTTIISLTSTSYTNTGLTK